MQKRLSVVLDIGTTTVHGKLIDSACRKELSYFSCLNEQLSHGHDIISRIKFCLEKHNGLNRLHDDIVSSINFIIDNLVSFARENKNDIYRIIAVGNTAMYYFTLALHPKKLVIPPYEPDHKDFVIQKANSLGIKANKSCLLHFLPNIGGFVGSDAIGTILASNLDKSRFCTLAADIGTNGEIIAGSKHKIYVASTAAGPAFEGWHIKCGMRAVKGAIESVEEGKNRLNLKIIGGGEPKGISGSGLIDLIALLLKRGYITKTGKIKDDFMLYDNSKKIYLTQNDIRQAQLARAAFLSTIKILKGRLSQEVAQFIITGNFGRRLNKKNAKTIGIIPHDMNLKNVYFLQNSALNGAMIFANDPEATKRRIKNILKKAEHVILNHEEGFQKKFVSSINF